MLERSHTIGGRVRTDAVDGFALDHGFQVLPTSYPEARTPSTTAGSSSGSSSVARSSARANASAGSPTLAVTRSEPPHARRRPRLRQRRPGTVRLLRGSDEETTAGEALRRAGVPRATVERFFVPFLRGVFLEEQLATSSRFLDFVLHAFADGPAALPHGGMGAIPAQLAEGLEIQRGTGVATVGPGAVSLESGEQLRGEAVVVATAGLVDEPPHGWNGVRASTTTPRRRPSPAPGSSSTAKAGR